MTRQSLPFSVYSPARPTAGTSRSKRDSRAIALVGVGVASLVMMSAAAAVIRFDFNRQSDAQPSGQNGFEESPEETTDIQNGFLKETRSKVGPGVPFPSSNATEVPTRLPIVAAERGQRHSPLRALPQTLRGKEPQDAVSAPKTRSVFASEPEKFAQPASAPALAPDSFSTAVDNGAPTSTQSPRLVNLIQQSSDSIQDSGPDTAQRPRTASRLIPRRDGSVLTTNHGKLRYEEIPSLIADEVVARASIPQDERLTDPIGQIGAAGPELSVLAVTGEDSPLAVPDEKSAGSGSLAELPEGLPASDLAPAREKSNSSASRVALSRETPSSSAPLQSSLLTEEVASKKQIELGRRDDGLVKASTAPALRGPSSSDTPDAAIPYRVPEDAEVVFNPGFGSEARRRNSPARFRVAAVSVAPARQSQESDEEARLPGRLQSDSLLGVLPLHHQPDGTVSMRLGDLIGLLEEKMEQPLFVWLKSSSSASKYVTFDTLRAAGLDVDYDPVSSKVVISVDNGTSLAEAD